VKFNRRKQLPGESFEQFLNELRNMSKSCGFCGCILDTMIMDRIIDGHKYQVVKEKLIAQDKVELKTVINMCREPVEEVNKFLQDAGNSDPLGKHRLVTSLNAMPSLMTVNRGPRFASSVAMNMPSRRKLSCLGKSL